MTKEMEEMEKPTTLAEQNVQERLSRIRGEAGIRRSARGRIVDRIQTSHLRRIDEIFWSDDTRYDDNGENLKTKSRKRARPIGSQCFNFSKRLQLTKIHDSPHIYIMDQFLTETELVHLEKKIASAESERLFQKSFVDKLEEEKNGEALSSETESLEGLSMKIHETWVQCDNCKKWRKLRNSIDDEQLQSTWFCSMNTTDPERSSCTSPEEEYKTTIKTDEVETKPILQTHDNANDTWIECDLCKKWRKLRGVEDDHGLPSIWNCFMNKTDQERSTCTSPEEEWSEEAYAYDTSKVKEHDCTISDSKAKEHVKERYDKQRTSTFVHFSKLSDSKIAAIENRAADLLGLPNHCIEPLQLVRYSEGQYFGAHHDTGVLFEDGSVELPAKSACSPPRRLVTIFVYLNDMPNLDCGGCTHFPLLMAPDDGQHGTTIQNGTSANIEGGLNVHPKRGRAVLFCNIDRFGMPDPRTVHAGQPVKATHTQSHGSKSARKLPDHHSSKHYNNDLGDNTKKCKDLNLAQDSINKVRGQTPTVKYGINIWACEG